MCVLKLTISSKSSQVVTGHCVQTGLQIMIQNWPVKQLKFISAWLAQTTHSWYNLKICMFHTMNEQALTVKCQMDAFNRATMMSGCYNVNEGGVCLLFTTKLPASLSAAFISHQPKPIQPGQVWMGSSLAFDLTKRPKDEQERVQSSIFKYNVYLG